MAAASSLLMSGVSLGTGFMESAAAEAEGKFARQQAEFNARLAELNAEEAIQRGEKEARSFKREAQQFKGSQAAAMATQGVDVKSESFERVRADTEKLTAFDEMEIRNRAWREAWGLKVEASSERLQGKFAEKAGKAKARTSLLTGGLSAIGYGADAYGKWGESSLSGMFKKSSAAGGGGTAVARAGSNKIYAG